ALRLLRGSAPGAAPEVVTVSAVEQRGIDSVWDSILQHRQRLESSGELAQKRARQQKAWLHNLLEDSLKERFFAQPAVRAALPGIEAAVDGGEITPTEGARRLLELLDD
ncbi:MAG TPA: methylmalonyl Co-A mutase-associated GTPase MeaB, partial [Polyangiaceae bacterium]|nr:methylmalonyl Co-A mutase-associated GTPase MeaB [Polyangiaceae bacterium]